jgi:hypothetical protein
VDPPKTMPWELGLKSTNLQATINNYFGSLVFNIQPEFWRNLQNNHKPYGYLANKFRNVLNQTYLDQSFHSDISKAGNRADTVSGHLPQQCGQFLLISYK